MEREQFVSHLAIAGVTKASKNVLVTSKSLASSPWGTGDNLIHLDKYKTTTFMSEETFCMIKMILFLRSVLQFYTGPNWL